VFRVHQRYEISLGRVVPLSGRRLSAGILRGGDDLEILAQIEAASSPGRPGEQQHFLTAKIR
jgi:hypothetical protein